MADKSKEIESAVNKIVTKNNLDLALVEKLMRGYDEGRWSSSRLLRELDIDRNEFWYIKTQYSAWFGCSRDAYYLTEDEKQAETETQSAVANFVFGDGEKPAVADSDELTLKRVGILFRKTARRTILVPLNHDVICELHKLYRLDILEISTWETHLAKTILLAATFQLGFKKSLMMMRALPKSIFLNDDDVFRGRKNISKKLLASLSNTASSYLANDLQDDAERDIDTIFITSDGMNQTIDSRNFVVNVESLIKLVDEK